MIFATLSRIASAHSLLRSALVDRLLLAGLCDETGRATDRALRESIAFRVQPAYRGDVSEIYKWEIDAVESATGLVSR